MPSTFIDFLLRWVNSLSPAGLEKQKFSNPNCNFLIIAVRLGFKVKYPCLNNFSSIILLHSEGVVGELQNVYK